MFTVKPQLSFLLVLLCWSAIAEAAPQIQARLTPQQMRSDESAALQIDIQWPQEEAQYKFMIPNFILSNLEVQQHGEAHEYFVQDGANWVRKTMTFTLKPKAVGQGKVERFRFSYIDPAAQKGGSQELGPFEVRIDRAPSQGAFQFMPWGLAGLLALFALSAGVSRSKRKQNRSATKTSGPKPLQQELARLQAMQSQQPGQTRRDTLQETQEIFKKVLIQFYELPAHATTETGILKALESKGLSRDETRAIQKLLDGLAEAKYSGEQFLESDFDNLCLEISHFVESRQNMSTQTAE